MKSNLRRICCLLLALAMIFSVAACGKATDGGSALDFEDEGWDIDAGNTDVDASTDEGSKTQTGNTSTVNSQGGSTTKQPAVKNADSLSLAELTAQIPSKLRGTTVHVFSWNPAKDVTGAEKVIADFEKKTGIKVKWEQGSYETYDESIVAKINSGAAPDVIRYNEPNPGRMSMCQDLKTATGFDFAGDIWDPSIRKEFTVKGKTYGVNMKNTFNKQPTVVIYLKSTIENNQLEDPYQLWKQGKWTFDKFIEMCKQFKSETGMAGWMSSWLIDIMWYEHLSFINFDNATGVYTNNSTSPQVVNALQRVCDWRAEGVMSGGMRETSAFTSGNYLFYTTNILGLRRNDSQHYVEQKKNNDVYCVPFPAQTGKTYWQSNQESESFGIPKGAKNASAVYYFLRYYLDRENYDEKMFFSNSQILEVYDWCISQPNQHHVFDRKLTKAYGEELCDITVDIRGGLQSAQVKTFLESVSPEFQHATNEANKVVAKF